MLPGKTLMKANTVRLLPLLLFFTTALPACGSFTPTDSRVEEPVVFESTGAAPTDTPADAPITEDAGGYARAFYRAWELGDYLGMYSLLAPSSQAVVDSAAFVARYAETMDTAAIEAVHTQPLAMLQEGDTAEYGVRVTLTSAVVGDIVRDHTTRLAYEGGRWGIVWDEGLILPELAGGNRLALERWQMPWPTFVHTPSRFTAEPVAREARAALLAITLYSSLAPGFWNLTMPTPITLTLLPIADSLLTECSFVVVAPFGGRRTGPRSGRG